MEKVWITRRNGTLHLAGTKKRLNEIIRVQVG